ncbi:hypothetical protein MDL93_10840, partial [Streptococcus suis]|uniref:phage tail spike protein n=1 Tax=Streptococcus suis TaxID=1307 RepID=UPI001EFF0EFC
MIFLKLDKMPLSEAYDDEIVQEANGKYQLSFKFPRKSDKWQFLTKENLLLADDLHGEQEFRIFEVVRRHGYVTVYANQVADDLNYKSITSISVDRVPGQTVMSALAGSIIQSHAFSFFSDISGRHSFNQSDVSVMKALSEGKHSIIGQWGGELVRDKYQVKLLERAGVDSEVLFMYKKNLTTFDQSESVKGLVTRLHLKKTIEENGNKSVIKTTVDSPLIGQYQLVYEANLEVQDQDVATVEQLRQYGIDYFRKNLPDIPDNSLSVDVANSADYNVKLFDTAIVHYDLYDIDMRMQITSYKYSPQSKKLKSVGFGKIKTSLTQQIRQEQQAQNDKLESVISEQELKLQAEIDNANRHFDAEFYKRVESINDGIEQAKAEAEAYADNIKQSIDADINAVNQSMQSQAEEHDKQVADILSKTQSVEELANQAKTDATSAIAQALLSKDEAIADARAQVSTVSQALNTAKTDLQNQVDAVDAKAVKVQSDATALRIDLDLQAGKILEQAQTLNTAKSDLQNQVNAIDAKAQTLTADLTNSKNDILAQAYAQTALNSRVTTVETTANGTKETVTQLSKTVNDLSGEVSSATQSIKTVEDSIDGVYTTLSKIQVGGANLLNRTRDLYYNSNKTNNTSETYQDFTVASGVSAGTGYVDIYRQEMNTVADKTDYFMTFYAKGMVDGQTIDCYFFNPTSTKRAESSQGTVTTAVDGKTTITLATTWQRYWIKWTQSAGTTAKTVLIGRNSSTNRAYVTMPALFEGNTIRDWAGSLQDSSMEFAEYKQTIDGQLTNLSNSYQTLNGQVNQNTVKIETTANSIREELTSLQSYVDDEGVRRTEYLTVSELKTAELISAERTKVARDYVAKSTYDEDVRGTTLKLNEIKTTADTAKQNLATYQETVDRKLTELTSSTQSLDGKINTASAKVDAVAGQIRTELATVEGKIPTEIGGRNLALNTSSELSTAWTSFNTDGTPINITLGKVLTDGLKTGDTIQVYINVLAELQGSNIVMRLQGDGDVTGWSNGAFPISAWRTYTSAGGYTFSYTAIINDDHIRNSYWTARLRVDGATSGWVRHRRFKVERGKVRTDWSPAPEDLINELSSVKTTITQTSQGVEQLSTSLSTTNGKVTTAETKISQLISDVSSKVSQTDYNTLTGRVSSAESAITQNATEISKRLTSTQVESAITGKGYQTKSDVDSNITGRGYITSSALQPYALAATVQTLVRETADSFSRTISAVETKIPTQAGGTNLVRGSADLKQGANGWREGHWRNSGGGGTVEYNATLPSSPVNGIVKGVKIVNSDNNQIGLCQDKIALEPGTYTMSVWVIGSRGLKVHISGAYSQDTSNPFVSGNTFVTLGRYGWTLISQTFTLDKRYENLTLGYMMLDSAGTVYFAAPYIHKSSMVGDWSLAPEDLAAVTALHEVKDTVSSHTRTIGAVGETGSILDNVSKVTQTAQGLVQEVSGTNGLKTQVSTLAGSYAIKNLT